MIRRLWLRWRWTALAVALFGYPAAENWDGWVPLGATRDRLYWMPPDDET